MVDLDKGPDIDDIDLGLSVDTVATDAVVPVVQAPDTGPEPVRAAPRRHRPAAGKRVELAPPQLADLDHADIGAAEPFVAARRNASIRLT